MNITGLLLLLVVALTACDKLPHTDTVESLVANPEQVKKVERLCKADHATVGDALCNMASEARRRRFMGDGKNNYTPSTIPNN